MNKRLVIPLVAVFAIALVAAGVYYVSTVNLTVDVKEAFTVEYAILGDAGNYGGSDATVIADCSGVTTWAPLSSVAIDKDGFYPMEKRAICVRITNKGEASMPYRIQSTTSGAAGCATAFANVVKTGTANQLSLNGGITYNGAVVQIAADATPVLDCNVMIEVGRGTA